MADFNSSLPVRTESPGDIISKIADATTPTQQLAINATGQALVLDGSDGPVAPGAAASFSSLAAGQFNTVLPTLAATEQAALQLDASARLIIAPLDSSSSVTALQGTSPWVVSGTVAVTQSTSPWITHDDHDENYGTVGATTLRTAAQIGNAAGAADFNYGAVGAQTLRTASEIGNATGAADFGNGATSAQTLRVAANLAIAGADVSGANPVPVTVVSTTAGTSVDDYKDATAIAAGSSDNHDYTVTAGKTLILTQVEGSASGMAKMTVAIETGVATGVFTTKFVQFNSTATPNMLIAPIAPISVAAGVRVRCTMMNRDKAAEDLYSTICGTES